MSWNLSKPQFDALNELEDHRRYEYFVKKVADYEELWGLKGDGGWVLAGDGVHELYPVWPHLLYAQSCANGQWDNTKPTRISLDEWIKEWLPDIAGENRLIAVFPTSKMRGFVVTPDRLKDDIEQELCRYDF